MVEKPQDVPQDKTQPQSDPSADVNAWLGKVHKARLMRDERSSRFRWKELQKEYKGEWPLSQYGFDIAILPINLVFAYVKTELPSLYIRDPHIKVNPKNRTSVWTSKVLEAVINYIWAHKRLKREIKKCIIDALVVGHAWFKVGYTGKFGTVEDNGQTIEAIESEDYFGYHIPWDCITFDANDAVDPPYDCAWIAHDVWLSPDDVKNNPRYKREATEEIHIALVSEPNNTYSAEESTSERERRAGKVCVTEVWDFKKRQVFSIAPGCDDYLEDPKPFPYEMRRGPFSFLKFNFSNDEPYGLSDTGMAEAGFIEKIKIRSAEVDHLKRFNRQILAEQNAFASVDEETKFTEGVTGAIIHMTPDAVAQGRIKITDFGALNPDIYQVEDRIDNDIANVLGQTAAERGGQAKTSTRTIKELMEQVKGAENRRSEKIDTVEDFVGEIADNLVSLIKQFADEPYYVRVMGNNSPELQQAINERPSATSPSGVTNPGSGFTFTSDDIAGEFDIEVVPGSSTPLDRGEKVKALVQILELLPQTGATPGGPLYGAVARMYAEEMDMPELLLALDQEMQIQQQQKAEQAQMQKQQQDMVVAKQATDTQIKAENAAAKHNKMQIEFLKAQNERAALQQQFKQNVEDAAKE